MDGNNKGNKFNTRTKWDIDCNVTFPSPDEGGTGGEASPVTVPSPRDGVRRDRRVPVVILLGWAGCRDRNLAKYGDIYGKRYITIRYIAPPKDLFFKTDRLREAARRLLELILDLDLGSNPIFVHSFSNGGVSVYRWISELIHQNPEYKNIRLGGAIFDSTPGRRNIFRGARALMMSLNRPLFVKYWIVFLFFCFTCFMFCINEIRYVLMPRLAATDFWRAINNEPSTCPQLYLYSKADKLISYRDIDEHIAARKRRLVDVRSICWPDSEHVAHLLKHRETYVKSCLDFVESGKIYHEKQSKDFF